MVRAKRRLAAVLLALGLSLSGVAAQDEAWQSDIMSGRAAYKRGDYADAEQIFLRALETAETFGRDDARIALTLNDLGLLFKAQGRYGEAETALERALPIMEKALGPEHRDVAANLNNLADLFSVQGRYGEAEPLYRGALVVFEKARGPQHSDVATTLGALADLLRVQGRYAEAEPAYRRALAIFENALVASFNQFELILIL
jgi:tetratricopeptide (TPR) repeat protein